MLLGILFMFFCCEHLFERGSISIVKFVSRMEMQLSLKPQSRVGDIESNALSLSC